MIYQKTHWWRSWELRSFASAPPRWRHPGCDRTE